jgi:hypothetical protein
LVPATSYGFAVAARALRVGPADRVLVLAEEYPSGVYTWRATGAEVVTVERDADRPWTEAVLDVLDERISVVSVPNVHWTDGGLVDLAAVADRSHAVGARLVIDGSQSVGAMPLDVAALRPDIPGGRRVQVAAGPVRRRLPLRRRPSTATASRSSRTGSTARGRRTSPASWTTATTTSRARGRFDVGQRTKFELVPMAIAALEQLTAWGVDGVAARLAEVTGAIAERTSGWGSTPCPSAQRGPHLLGLAVPDSIRDTVLPALAKADCYAALRGRALRISPHLHVTERDRRPPRRGAPRRDAG